MPQKRPNCVKCEYFYVTYQPAHPWACSYFEIKSKKYPSQVVFASTGEQCPMFRLKERLKGK
ncbi:hypothetical protein BVY04_02740 [bacterium M21]|nr:hypothetical protein BVY04_02740 [bacterium M21]